MQTNPLGRAERELGRRQPVKAHEGAEKAGTGAGDGYDAPSPISRSDDGNACPACGSDDLGWNDVYRCVCAACGHEWNTNPPPISRNLQRQDRTYRMTSEDDTLYLRTYGKREGDYARVWTAGRTMSQPLTRKQAAFFLRGWHANARAGAIRLAIVGHVKPQPIAYLDWSMPFCPACSIALAREGGADHSYAVANGALTPVYHVSDLPEDKRECWNCSRPIA